MRAEGFSCSMDVLYGGLGIDKLHFFYQKNFIIFFSCKFFPIFGHQNPGSGSVFSLKCWIWIQGYLSGSTVYSVCLLNLDLCCVWIQIQVHICEGIKIRVCFLRRDPDTGSVRFLRRDPDVGTSFAKGSEYRYVFGEGIHPENGAV